MVECAEIEQLAHDLADPKYAKEACKKIGVEYFQAIIRKDGKFQKSIRENVKKAKYKITGSGEGWSLIRTLAEYGRELAIQLLFGEGCRYQCNLGAGHGPGCSNSQSTSGNS